MSYYLIGDSGSVYFEPFAGIIESEGASYSNKVTSNPIEGGSTVTDHAVADPVKLDISGIVTNMPGARDTLIAMRDNRDLLTYRGADAYENMLITSLSISRSKDAGPTGFIFKLTLQKMQIVGAAYAPVVATMRGSDAAASTALRSAQAPTNVGLVTPASAYAAHVNSFTNPTPNNTAIAAARRTVANRGYSTS